MEGTGKFQEMGAAPREEAARPNRRFEPAAVGESAFPRLRVRGKFLFSGEEKFYLRGVTYGPFPPEPDGSEYHTPDCVDRDFARMAAAGFNAVRTYTVPPGWVLDLAAHHRLRVMVGLPWEQHVAFLDDRAAARRIRASVVAGVRACAGHPAVFAYALGNEIPSPIVRWHGARRVEGFLRSLFREARKVDPEAIFTYVNYPSTEYLRTPDSDLAAYNVYLERQGDLDAYLARLQHLAGERPLVLAEVGLDSRRNGDLEQARVLDWQLRTSFAAGCAGAFLFAWTDEWHRGGREVEDWDFGLTTRDRKPKPALHQLEKTLPGLPFTAQEAWPRISVIVCTYNGHLTLRDTLDGLRGLQYPDYEVVLVDDGSREGIGEIASGYDVCLVRTHNQGLSTARNTGLAAATGEIVAYIDDDAWPDPHWLHYLASTFRATGCAAAGGPNLPPPEDGWIAQCIANAPGGPVHVLLSDTEAEHVPGCNMAFVRERLVEIGGFDPRFRNAGDDVDVCWRIQDQGWSLAFSPAAVVWHHRRNSVKAYWRQQVGYGKAEALLEAKWPERYNALGHLTWAGRLYGGGLASALRLSRWRVYHGVWGSAPFQSVYEPARDTLLSLPLMPEWYLVIAGLAGLSFLSLWWWPLWEIWPLFGLSAMAPVVQSLCGSTQARFPSHLRTPGNALRTRSLTAVLHLLQPMARLWGRLRHGLTPWRRRRAPGFALPRPRGTRHWRERWEDPLDTLAGIEAHLLRDGAACRRGGEFDRWDLEVRGGILGGVRALAVVEEHGAGKQLVRLRCWPRLFPAGLWLSACLLGMAAWAGVDGHRPVAIVLAVLGSLLVGRGLGDCAAAEAAWEQALTAVGLRERS
jgi:GT2 family glycosyltransferase